MKYSVPVHVRSSFTGAEGTWITERDRALEARALTGLACVRGQVRVELAGIPARAAAVADLTGLLADLNVSADMIGHQRGAGEAKRADIAFTLPESELPRARPVLERAVAAMGSGEVRVSKPVAKVSLVGIGVRSDPGVAAHLCRSLVRHGIAVSGLMVSELRISCLVDEAEADRAVALLHDVFGLSQSA